MTAALVAAVTATPALAFDVGDPVYKGDMKGAARVELIYENFDRDAVFTDYTLRLQAAGESVSQNVEDDDTSTDSDVLMLRVSLLASEKAAFYFDGGAIDDDRAEDQPLVIGAGGRLLAYQKGAARINIVASGHYVPKYDVEIEGVDDDLGAVTSNGDVYYYEMSGGVLLSGDVALDSKTKFVPYGGLLLSMLGGDFEAEVSVPDVGVAATSSADIEEDDPLVGVVGASLVFLDNLSIRVEGRLIGDASVSGAFGASF